MAASAQTTRRAVLTGDVVDSSKLKLAERRRLTEALNNVFGKFNVKSKNELGLKVGFEWFRGDGFQGVVEDPAEALRLALVIRTYLQGKVIFASQTRKTDARIAIGIGKITFKAASLSESDGEALQFSGRLLDSMKKLPNRIALKSTRLTLDEEINVSCVLLEDIITKWTAPQAEVIYYKLLNYKEVMIAELLNIKQPTVNQRAKAASWLAVERLLQRYQALVSLKR